MTTKLETGRKELLNSYKDTAYEYILKERSNLDYHIEDILCYMEPLVQEDTRSNVAPRGIVELMENIMQAAQHAQDNAHELIRNQDQIDTVNKELGVN